MQLSLCSLYPTQVVSRLALRMEFPSSRNSRIRGYSCSSVNTSVQYSQRLLALRVSSLRDLFLRMANHGGNCGGIRNRSAGTALEQIAADPSSLSFSNFQNTKGRGGRKETGDSQRAELGRRALEVCLANILIIRPRGKTMNFRECLSTPRRYISLPDQQISLLYALIPPSPSPGLSVRSRSNP